jgi:hypothetical protein
MSELWRRIPARLWRRSVDRDLDEELRFHLEMNRPRAQTGDWPGAPGCTHEYSCGAESGAPSRLKPLAVNALAAAICRLSSHCERVGFVLLRAARSGGTSSCLCAILRLARRAEAHAEAVAGVSEGWRRGWDSNPTRRFRFCKLQIPHCRYCRECQRCRGTLHAIARTVEPATDNLIDASQQEFVGAPSVDRESSLRNAKIFGRTRQPSSVDRRCDRTPPR